MSSLKLSSTFGAVLTAVALLIAGCNVGGGLQKQKPPTLPEDKPVLKLQANPVLKGSAFAHDESASGDGTTAEKAVVFRAPLLKAKFVGSLDLGNLVKGLKGKASYEVSGVSDANMGYSTDSSAVKDGVLTIPQGAGELTVKVTDGANGNYLYMKIIFNKQLLAVASSASGVRVSSVADRPWEAEVTVPADNRVILKALLPYTYQDVTWTLLHAGSDTSDTTNYAINALKSSTTTLNADATLQSTDILAGLNIPAAASSFRPWDGTRFRRGRVKLQAAVTAGSEHQAGEYLFTVVFSDVLTGLTVARSAVAGEDGLLFDPEKDGTSAENAVVVRQSRGGKPDTRIRMAKKGPSFTEVAPFDLAGLVNASANLSLSYSAGGADLIDADTAAAAAGFQWVPSAGDVVIKVTAASLPKSLFFKLAFRFHAADLVLAAAASKLKTVEDDAVELLASERNLVAFTLTTPAPASADVTGEFDFTYVLSIKKAVNNWTKVDAPWGTTAAPTGLSGLLAGTYRLDVTAKAKATSASCMGTTAGIYYFKIPPTHAADLVLAAAASKLKTVEDDAVELSASERNLVAFTLTTPAPASADVTGEFDFTYVLSIKKAVNNWTKVDAPWGTTAAPTGLSGLLAGTYRLDVTAKAKATSASCMGTTAGIYYFKIPPTHAADLVLAAAASKLKTVVGDAVELSASERNLVAFTLTTPAPASADVTGEFDFTYVLSIKKAVNNWTKVDAPWGTTAAPTGLSGLLAGTYRLDVTAKAKATSASCMGTTAGIYYFKIPPTHAADLVLAAAASKLKTVEDDAVELSASERNLVAFTLTTPAPASADVTGEFDFTYVLSIKKAVNNWTKVDAPWGTTAAPTGLSGLLAGTYRLDVTAKAKVTSAKCVGETGGTFYFKVVTPPATFWAALVSRVATDDAMLRAGTSTPVGYGSILEVRLTQETYFSNTGELKTNRAGNLYKVNWEAYRASDTTSVKGSGYEQVAIEDLSPARAGGKRVSLKRVRTFPVTLVVQVYQPGTAAESMGLGKVSGRVAEYTLTLTEAARPNLVGYKVSAKGLAAAAVPSTAEINDAPVMRATVVRATVVRETANYVEAFLNLSGATAASATATNVAFNSFSVVKADGNPDTGLEWKITAGAPWNSDMPKTKVTGATGVDAGSKINTAIALESGVRADFTATTATYGEVRLVAFDKYGARMTIYVILNDGF